MLARGRAVFDEAGEAVRLAGSLTDVSERKRLEERLRHEARHDTLTGLANRRLLIERLDATLARHDRSGAEFAVVLLDLDGFKQVNDAHGHEAGDAVLIEVARRLEQNIRPHDLAARLGGDEFALLLEDLEPGRLELVAGRLHDALGERHLMAGHSVHVPASLGVVRSLGAATVGTLLRTADVAMYEAKTAGHPVVTAT